MRHCPINVTPVCVWLIPVLIKYQPEINFLYRASVEEPVHVTNDISIARLKYVYIHVDISDWQSFISDKLYLG